MPIDVSKLAAATDEHTRAAGILQSLVTHLAAQNHVLIERLKAALAHDPSTADHVETQSHMVEVQKQADDLAAKLEASAKAMGETAAANQPGEIPKTAPETKPAETVAAA